MTKEMRTVEFVILPAARDRTRKMFQMAGACRYVRNHLREKNLADCQTFRNARRERPHTGHFRLGVEFARLRHKTGWMRELPSNPTKHTLKCLADALKEAKAAKKGFAKPRSAKRTIPGFESNEDTNAARNIRCLAMTQLHGEEPCISTVPMNREIDARQPDG